MAYHRTIVYRLVDNCATSEEAAPTGIALKPCDVRETETCGWTVQESFYYSVQTGLSIGFGLLSESSDISRLYSVFHILAGSSFIGGALALFAALAVTRHEGFQGRQERKLAQVAEKMGIDGYKGLGADELRRLMIRHPPYYRDLLDKLEDDSQVVHDALQKYKALARHKRSELAIDLLERLAKAGILKDGGLRIDDLTAIRKERLQPHKAFLRWINANANTGRIYLVFLVWILIGIIFGIAAEKWSFIQSLYFAVSTLSTAGLQGVTQTDDGWHVLFAAVYALIGVPLYGMCLGSFGGLLVDRYNEARFEEKANAKIHKAEIQLVDHLLGETTDDAIDMSTYITLQLLKTGSIDRDTLQSFRDMFKTYDKNGTGKVAMKDLVPDHARKREHRNHRLSA